ncbi:protein O-mannosyl-transferase TMTC4 [Chelonus insularis]|uniref:protein O-mannosyl-transferase TMTC4 n=1 Tax=Chelonus insularis TaxID=460826 RepID=UPI00158DFE9D|nr:protein O-mannosyl-transferase TMTC4 [Chelonus insularis]
MMSLKVNCCLPVIPPPLALFIIFIASLCCINSYDGSFVFDDSPAILNNADISSTPLLTIFKNDFWGNKLTHKQSHRSYRPFTVLTFRLHYWIRGYLNSVDFHIVNLILHSLACILVYYVFKKLLDKNSKQLAFYAALLFAVHPVHSEAISGIVGRADILSAIFVWLSILFYDCWMKEKNYCIFVINIFICTLCIASAMLFKETGITAIGICFAYDLIIINKKNVYDGFELLKFNKHCNILKKMVKSSSFLRFVILSIVGMLLLLLRFSLMGFSTPTFQPVDNPASFIDNIFLRHVNYQYIYALNLWLLICPEWLSFDWSMGCVPLITGWDPRLFAIILLWIVFGFLLIKFFLMKQKDDDAKYIAIGLSMMIIPFLPASNLFFNVGFVLAERTLYLPSAGYCFVIVVGLKKLCERFSIIKMPLIMYFVLVITWFARSWIRSEQWKNEHLLFRSALSVCPLNAKVHYNVAKNAADLGNITLAEAEYLEALRLNPTYAQAMNNLGNLLKDQGKYKKAEKLLRQAVEIQQDFAAAWMNLGIVLSSLKQYEESEKCYKTSLSYRRHCPDCYFNYGLLFMERQQYLEALKTWSKAIDQEQKHRRAWINSIRLLDDMGMSEKALKQGMKAKQLIPDDAMIRLNIANILGKSERYIEAENEFQTALMLDPYNPTIYTNLGVLYHRWHKLDKAKIMYNKALELDPNHQNAKLNIKKLQNLLTKKHL